MLKVIYDQIICKHQQEKGRGGTDVNRKHLWQNECMSGVKRSINKLLTNIFNELVFNIGFQRTKCNFQVQSMLDRV